MVCQGEEGNHIFYTNLDSFLLFLGGTIRSSEEGNLMEEDKGEGVIEGPKGKIRPEHTVYKNSSTLGKKPAGSGKLSTISLKT